MLQLARKSRVSQSLDLTKLYKREEPDMSPSQYINFHKKPKVIQGLLQAYHQNSDLHSVQTSSKITVHQPKRQKVNILQILRYKNGTKQMRNHLVQAKLSPVARTTK